MNTFLVVVCILDVHIQIVNASVIWRGRSFSYHPCSSLTVFTFILFIFKIAKLTWSRCLCLHLFGEVAKVFHFVFGKQPRYSLCAWLMWVWLFFYFLIHASWGLFLFHQFHQFFFFIFNWHDNFICWRYLPQQSQLAHAANREDFIDASRLKVAIAAAAINDTVGRMMSHLNVGELFYHYFSAVDIIYS